MSCSNHLKQIGLALQMHHDTYNLFPSNGGWDGKQQISSASGTAVFVTTQDKDAGTLRFWGVGEPGRAPRDQTGSWAYAILPYVEQQNIYQTRAWREAIKLYVCPSRRRAEAVPVVAEDAYGVYNGGGWTWGKIDYACNSLVMPERPRCMGLSALTDGASHTILVGEKAFNPQVQVPTTWYYDEPFFLGGSGGTTRWLDGVHRDDTNTNLYRGNWGAVHKGGAQFLFADGSVRTIPYDTPKEIVRGAMTPAGGEGPPAF